MRGKIRSLLLPSLADIFFLCPFLILSLNSGDNLLNDSGTGFHIRAGEYIVNNFSIPKHDIFSSAVPRLPWVAHEWLSESIMAIIHRVSGLTGVVLFFSLLIACTYFLLFKLVISDGDILLACFVVFLAAASSTLHWLARPHVFSLILVALWYYVLNAYQYKNNNYLYLLPLTMLLWVNLHGGFIIGFVLLAIYLCGNAAAVLFSPNNETGLYKEKFWALTCVALVCAVFSVVNPQGIYALLFPFKTVSQQFLIDTTMEYLSPNFHDPLPFKYLLLLTIAVMTASRAKVDFMEVALVLLFTYMALYSVRHIPLFAIIVAPILVRHTEAMLSKANGKFINMFKSRSDNLATLNRDLKGHLWPVIVVFGICIFTARGVIQFKFNEARIPLAAVNFLMKEKIKGNMFNSDQFGDYLIYAAWPQYKVFVDGRSDMYGSDRMREYMKVALIQPGWKEVLAKYDINFIVYNANSPLSVLLSESANWRLVYADKTANVFVRNITANRDLINKYPDAKLVWDNDSTKGAKMTEAIPIHSS
jgi:hypothetical protein